MLLAGELEDIVIYLAGIVWKNIDPWVNTDDFHASKGLQELRGHVHPRDYVKHSSKMHLP